MHASSSTAEEIALSTAVLIQRNIKILPAPEKLANVSETFLRMSFNFSLIMNFLNSLFYTLKTACLKLLCVESHFSKQTVTRGVDISLRIRHLRYFLRNSLSNIFVVGGTRQKYFGWGGTLQYFNKIILKFMLSFRQKSCNGFCII